jgi:hypothetical protein
MTDYFTLPAPSLAPLAGAITFCTVWWLAFFDDKCCYG